MTRPARINRTTSRAQAAIGLRALDDAHLTWIAAEIESEHALRAWFGAAVSNRAASYLAYQAAVDREEAAARDLERLSELTQPYQEQLSATR